LENYTLKSVDGKTELLIDLDVTDGIEEYMSDTWPKALQKVKDLAETK